MTWSLAAASCGVEWNAGQGRREVVILRWGPLALECVRVQPLSSTERTLQATSSGDCVAAPEATRVRVLGLGLTGLTSGGRPPAPGDVERLLG